MNVPIQKALADWRRCLGESNVSVATAERDLAQTATFATSQTIPAILKPATTEEVRRCLRIANDYKVPVYPVSRGNNWGLGSQVPAQDRNVLMDLSRMNRIVDYDESRAYITVEPGVSFAAANEFLRERNSRLMLSVTGGPPGGSVIGNTVERGNGIGPYGERLEHVCGFEVVLPTGECLHTGSGRFRNSAAVTVSRLGVGPYLDGMFTQSNLGVVTKMTMWLMPRPQFFQSFDFAVEPAQMAQTLDQAGDLVLGGVLDCNSFGLWNPIKAAASQGKKRSAAGSLGSRWSAGGGIYAASIPMGLAKRQIVESTFLHRGTLQFYEANQSSGVYLGLPTEQNIKSMYWRKQTPIPERIDPGRDHCGVIWLCCALPRGGAMILDAVDYVESVVNRRGFEPNLSLTLPSGRLVQLFLAIIYDRTVQQHDRLAMECHDEVFDGLVSRGHFPSRLGVHSMSRLPRGADDFEVVVQRLKRALDPHNILAPGRYDGSHHFE